MPPTEVSDLLDAVGKVLLRCWILGVILLLFWFGTVVLAGDFAYGVHGNMFDLTLHELKVIHYCGILLAKLVVGLFFFIPWVSIRLVLRKRK